MSACESLRLCLGLLIFPKKLSGLRESLELPRKVPYLSDRADTKQGLGTQINSYTVLEVLHVTKYVHHSRSTLLNLELLPPLYPYDLVFERGYSLFVSQLAYVLNSVYYL